MKRIFARRTQRRTASLKHLFCLKPWLRRRPQRTHLGDPDGISKSPHLRSALSLFPCVFWQHTIGAQPAAAAQLSLPYPSLRATISRLLPIVSAPRIGHGSAHSPTARSAHPLEYIRKEIGWRRHQLSLPPSATAPLQYSTEYGSRAALTALPLTAFSLYIPLHYLLYYD